MSYQLGFDIGGTFTDFTLIDSHTGQLKVFKSLTTPDDPAQGALNGMQEFYDKVGINHQAVNYIIHATTLVANTLIEHKGVPVGLITTQGFRDILEIRTEQRYDIFDLFLRYPPPLIPRYLRRGIKERVDRDGVSSEQLTLVRLRKLLSISKLKVSKPLPSVFFMPSEILAMSKRR